MFISIIFSSLFSFGQKEEENFQNYFSEAQRYIMLNNSDTAKYLLLKALEINPNSAAANYSLSSIYFNDTDYYLAISYGAKAVDIDPDNLWYKRNLRDLYLVVNDFSSVADIQRDILKISNFKDDYLSAFDFFINYKDYQSVLEFYKQYKDKFGYDLMSLSYFMQSAFALQKNDLLNSFISTLLVDFNSDPDSYVLVSIYYNLLGEAALVKPLLLNAVSDNVNNFSLNLELANIYFTENNPDSAYFYCLKSLNSTDLNISEFINMLKDNSNFNPISFPIYSDSLLNKLQTDFAGNDDVMFFVSDYFFRYNYFYDSINILEKIISDSYADYDVYVRLLNLYSKFSYWNNLDSLVTYTIELYPAQPYLFLFKGVALLNLNSLDDAYQNLSYGLSISFDNDILKSYFNFYLFVYYYLVGNTAQSNLYLNSCLDIAEHNCDLLAHFSFYLAKNTDNINKAMTIMSDCVMDDITELSPNIAYIYSYILYKYGDYKTANTNIDIAISDSNVNNFLFYELKGCIMSKLGDSKSADENWLKSVKYGNYFLNKEL